jgi:hypothetical protein
MADTLQSAVPGFTPETLQIQADFRRAVAPLATFSLGQRTVEVRSGRDTIWVVVRRPDRGAVALRTVPWSGDYTCRIVESRPSGLVLDVSNASGEWRIEICVLGETLRVITHITPKADLLLAFWPRDLYVLDAGDDPTGSQGWVEAAQRGFNTGLCYFCVDRPGFGSTLYVQNLSALNRFFEATGTRPDGVVGGEWPELGYQPPTAPMSMEPPRQPLPQGETVAISDALLAFRDACGHDEADAARQFIHMLAQLYPYLDKPEARDHDWADRAGRTLDDLGGSAEVWQDHYGYGYLRPYLGAETPDSMVQMAVLAAVRRYQAATGEGGALGDRQQAGNHRFFDPQLKSFRRYLDAATGDKDIYQVDSWYLYHPLVNLARLAGLGDEEARGLLLASLDFAIATARHFNYLWPILFDMRDFSVATQARSPQGRGQTDVGGLYAYLMLQAFELTGDDRYVAEARAALKAMDGMRFNTAYQTNLTAWGAVAAIKLWRQTGEDGYLMRSHVFIANLLHNVELWDSHMNNAGDYANFFGLTCLHDGPYMAAFEVYEAYDAMGEYLAVGADNLPEATRLLIGEFRSRTRDVAWYFYPDTLPPEAVATTIKNGRIDRDLSLPLEDLYGDGQPAGQVGQEIYGAGAALIFAMDK